MSDANELLLACEGCGTGFGLHEGWCPICLTKRIATLKAEAKTNKGWRNEAVQAGRRIAELKAEVKDAQDDGFDAGKQLVLAERTKLRDEVERLKAVVDAARNLRSSGITNDGADIIPQEFMGPLQIAIVAMGANDE